MIAFGCWGPLVRSESKAGSAKKSSPCLKGGGITGSKVGDGFSGLASKGFSLSSRLSLLSFSLDLKRWRNAFIVEMGDGWPDWTGCKVGRRKKLAGQARNGKAFAGEISRVLRWVNLRGNYYGVQVKKWVVAVGRAVEGRGEGGEREEVVVELRRFDDGTAN